MSSYRMAYPSFSLLVLLASQILSAQYSPAQDKPVEYQAKTIGIRVNPGDGSYTMFDPVSMRPILHATVAAELNHRWVRSSDYPQHSIGSESTVHDTGPGNAVTISNPA